MKKPIATAFLLFCIVLFSAYSNQEYINSLAISLFILLFISILLFLYYSYELYKNQISLKKFVQAVEGSDNIVMITDFNQNIKYVNQSFTDATGYTLDEVIGKNPGTIQNGQNAKTFYRKLNKTIYSGKKWSGIFINKSKDGKKQYEKATIIPITNDSGKIIEFVGLKLDITKEIDDQNALREKDRKFFHQTKMASMGEMLFNIAHHWRQPLSLISTVATSIELQREMNILTDEKLLKGMRDINKSVQSLSSTIEDFSNFFNFNKEKVYFTVDNIITRALNLAGLESNTKGIDIHLNIQEIALYGYDTELIQAIVNILNNAQEVISSKEIKIIEITTLNHQNELEIIIQDNGGGIPEEIIKSIFEPYFTTKHKSQGRGMGLYSSYIFITNKMDGEISATNDQFFIKDTRYYGAKFTIKIPKNV